MHSNLQPWQILLAALAGWVNRHQQHVIEYLQEENRVLKEQLGGKRLRLTDNQRRRLAVKGMEESVMRCVGLMVACVAVLVTGCGTAPEPMSQSAVHDPTAISPAELVEKYEQANAAYDAGEIARFCELTAALADAWPDHPRLIFNLARGHALEGRSDASLDLLDRLVTMRVAIDPTEDEDLRSLHELPRFTALVKRYTAAIEPAIGSEVAYRLDEPEFVPEDVAWDPVSGDLLLSSIRQRKIVRVDDQGRQSRFAGHPEIAMLAALSMAVDHERRRLWLTTAGTPSMIDYRAEEHEGRSELLGFDLDSGELVVRVAAPAEGDQHELNDLVVAADGSVLVGDAPVGAIYRLSPDSRSFETVVGPGAMFSPQGIVILPDGGQTLVADYSRGLCLLGADGGVRVLRSPEDAWLGGIDGLSVKGRRDLIAVQNGITPNRVVRIRLNETVDAVAAVDVLDLAHPEHDQPTLGEVVGDDFLYVANSLWGAWDEEGNLAEGRKLTPPVILRISLD
jgi:sugar lactone lactonase YvrE